MPTLYTAYCTRAGTVNTNNRAEVRFEFKEPNGITFGLDHGEVGKVALDSVGSAIQYDVSEIPKDASVTRARIVMTANTSDSSVFDSNISRYAFSGVVPRVPTPLLDSVTSAPHNHFKFRARAKDTASTELALAGATTNFDLGVIPGDGVSSPGQVLVLTSAGNGLLGSVSMWLRVASPPAGTCRAKVYSTAGSAREYSRGELLAASNTRPLSDMVPVTATELEFTLTSPLAVTSGQILIVEVELDPVPSSPFVVRVGGDTAGAFADENALMFGPTLEAFSKAVYASGVEHIFGNLDVGESELFVFPTFTAGSQVTFGDALYSPDVTLSKLTRFVQEMLDERVDSNRIAFRFRPQIFSGDFPTNGEKRQWRSADHATPQIVDGQSFFGTVLQIEYSVPGAVKAFPARARPAVAHGEVIARPAVSSPAVPRARAAVRSAEEARARPAIQRGEVRARPAVRRP